LTEEAGIIVHQYHALLAVDGAYVYLSAHGKTDLAALGLTCREIVCSVRLNRQIAKASRKGARRDNALPRAGSDGRRRPSSGGSGLAPGTYLSAKSRVRSKYARAAIILPDEEAGGVQLFVMAELDKVLFPGSSSWHESVEAARSHAADTLKTRDSDWITEQGEPEWAESFRKAAGDAIDEYVKARGNKAGM
jgi:hypothetical protein